MTWLRDEHDDIHIGNALDGQNRATVGSWYGFENAISGMLQKPPLVQGFLTMHSLLLLCTSEVVVRPTWGLQVHEALKAEVTGCDVEPRCREARSKAQDTWRVMFGVELMQMCWPLRIRIMLMLCGFLLCCRKKDIYIYINMWNICVQMHVYLPYMSCWSICVYIKCTCVCVCMWTCGHTHGLIIVNCKYVRIDCLRFTIRAKEKMAECSSLKQVMRTTKCAQSSHSSGICETYRILAFFRLGNDA